MSETKYPRRPQFFAHKFCRLLAKTAAAMTIGADTCWLLSIIVHQEDSVRYTKPVRFWNNQLSTLCGFGSRKRLVTSRAKAIDAGWLHYEPGRKSTPGLYWVTLPPGLSIADDGPCFESDIEVDNADVNVRQNGTANQVETEFRGNETEQKTELGVMNRNGKSGCTQRKGTAKGIETGFVRNETELQRGAMRNCNSAPFNPMRWPRLHGRANP